MQLFTVGSNHIDRAWREGAHQLSKACERAQGECTASQLKMRLARGELTLLTMTGDPPSWFAVSFTQHPNMRVLFIYAMSGRTSDEAMGLIEAYANQGGASAIEFAAYGAAARIGERRFGFSEVYRVLRKELWPAETIAPAQ